MRLGSFIIALLLLGGAVDPTRGWLIGLVVLTGLAAIRPRPWNWFDVRPAIDLRLAAFVLAALLLAGAIDPTRQWLIALSVVTGLAAFMPRAFGLSLGDGDRDGWWGRDRWAFTGQHWQERGDREWARWERRMDRRLRRRGRSWSEHWNEDWS